MEEIIEKIMKTELTETGTYTLWIVILLIIALIMEFVVNVMWWLAIMLLKRKKAKCSECHGLGGDTIDGENIWLECETCKNNLNK